MQPRGQQMTQEEIITWLEKIENRVAHSASNGWDLWRKIIGGATGVAVIAIFGAMIAWGQHTQIVSTHGAQIERNRTDLREMREQQTQVDASLRALERLQKRQHEQLMEVLVEVRSDGQRDN